MSIEKREEEAYLIWIGYICIEKRKEEALITIEHWVELAIIEQQVIRYKGQDQVIFWRKNRKKKVYRIARERF